MRKEDCKEISRFRLPSLGRRRLLLKLPIIWLLLSLMLFCHYQHFHCCCCYYCVRYNFLYLAAGVARSWLRVFCENFHRPLPPPSKTIHRDRRNIFTIKEALSIKPWVNKLTAGLLRKYCKPNLTNITNFPFHPSFLPYFDHLLNWLGTIFKSTNGKKKVEGLCKLIETPNATDEKHKRCFWHIAVRK